MRATRSRTRRSAKPAKVDPQLLTSASVDRRERSRGRFAFLALVVLAGCNPAPKERANAPLPAQPDTGRIGIGIPDSTMQQPVPGTSLPDVVPAYDVAPEVVVRTPARVVGLLPRFDRIRQSKNPQFLYAPDGRVRGAYVQAAIDEQGRVGEVLVSRGLGEPQTRAIEEAARGWRFRPALRGGKPVHAIVSIEVLLGRP
jgi:hypothetical protein